MADAAQPQKYTLEIEATVNGGIRAAIVLVLDANGRTCASDKADLSVAANRQRVGKSLARQLDDKDAAKWQNALERKWIDLLDQQRRLREQQRAGSVEGVAEATAPEIPSCTPGKQHLTDLGNARRVSARHGSDLRFCFDWKQFLIWDGRCWKPDNTGEAERRVKDTQGELYRFVADQLRPLANGDSAEREARGGSLGKILQHALKWEDVRRIEASLRLLRSEPGLAIVPADMDRDLWLLNVANGTLDLREGRLRPHRREDLLTKLSPVVYDGQAKCPVWERCLNQWMNGNADLVDYLRRVIGYSLTADVSEQVLFFLHGSGSNGKSTFLGTVREMLGDYGCQAVSELLMSKNTEAHPTERADLFGRRFVATIETEQGKRMAEALMKQLTGGDALKARRMRQDFFEVRPTWKIFLAANHKPVIRGTDFAVWRRIRLIPFVVTISDRDKDKNLEDKLKAELPGILAWAVRGCLEWQRHGLADPEEVRQATAAYQREQDTLAGFLADCCTVADFAKAKSSALLKAFQDWSGDKSITQQAFRGRMNDKGFESKQGTGGSFYFYGIGLSTSENEDYDSPFRLNS